MLLGRYTSALPGGTLPDCAINECKPFGSATVAVAEQVAAYSHAVAAGFDALPAAVSGGVRAMQLQNIVEGLLESALSVPLRDEHDASRDLSSMCPMLIFLKCWRTAR